MVHPGSIDTPIWERTGTATGHLPRRPPGAPAEDVADALVAMARNPRAETTFGLDAQVIETLWGAVRLVGDLLLAGVHHYYRSGASSKSDVSAALDAIATAVNSDAMPRPSLDSAVRLATTPLRLAGSSVRALRSS